MWVGQHHDAMRCATVYEVGVTYAEHMDVYDSILPRVVDAVVKEISQGILKEHLQEILEGVSYDKIQQDITTAILKNIRLKGGDLIP